MFHSPRPERGDLRGPTGDWWGLRTLLTWLGVGGYGLVVIVGAALLLLAGGYIWDPERRVFNRLSRWWGRRVLRLFPGLVELRGLEHLEGGPYVLAPNHQSMVDLLAMFWLPVDYRTVVKRSWFAPPFGLNIWTSGYVPTPKKGDPEGAKKVVEACHRWLQRGLHVLIFPEGTRARTWAVQGFKRGAFDLSVLSGRPVVPVAIAGTNDISHPSSLRFVLRPLRIIVEVLPPLPVSDDPLALMASCHEVLSEAVGDLRAELLDTYGQGPVSAPEAPAP